MKLTLKLIFIISMIIFSSQICKLQSGETISSFQDCYKRILDSNEKGDVCCYIKTKGNGKVNGISVNGESYSCVPYYMGKEQQYMDNLIEQKVFSNIDIQCSDYGVLTGNCFYAKFQYWIFGLLFLIGWIFFVILYYFILYFYWL